MLAAVSYTECQHGLVTQPGFNRKSGVEAVAGHLFSLWHMARLTSGEKFTFHKRVQWWPDLCSSGKVAKSGGCIYTRVQR